MRKSPVITACNSCRKAHARCSEGPSPCFRCSRLGVDCQREDGQKSHQCKDRVDGSSDPPQQNDRGRADRNEAVLSTSREETIEIRQVDLNPHDVNSGAAESTSLLSFDISSFFVDDFPSASSPTATTPASSLPELTATPSPSQPLSLPSLPEPKSSPTTTIELSTQNPTKLFEETQNSTRLSINGDTVSEHSGATLTGNTFALMNFDPLSFFPSHQPPVWYVIPFVTCPTTTHFSSFCAVPTPPPPPPAHMPPEKRARYEELAREWDELKRRRQEIDQQLEALENTMSSGKQRQ